MAFQAQGKAAALEAFGGTKLTNDGGSVLMLGVDGVVEAADVGGGEFAGEIGEGGAELGKLHECGLADDGDSIVGREVVAVVGEGDEAKGVDEAVRRVAGDDVDLMIDESTIDQAEVHDSRRFGEMEIVACYEAGEAVGTLDEFVADAGAPFGGDGSEVGNFLDMKFLRVVAADDDGERVFEAERLGDFEVEVVGVKLLDAVVDGVRITMRSFVEDGR